ncbi:hypothetical protein O1611_g5950 [Lasiodiplodia mahajangana]|uniref:Uncharacterized protein n=1 Tax=Lasiodiplodia mahajangana TaxID=1108764 RepID=A0ACC2JJH7_9PEZI|nr:hypothetical protein O1611_g5950 [Lasiodiplodia mahajangana]
MPSTQSFQALNSQHYPASRSHKQLLRITILLQSVIMKFTHVLVALVATVAQAQPLELAKQVEEAGQVLSKRADASFTVWTNTGKGP